MDSEIINISHLTKDYGQGRGVFDVSFSVNRGECFGFLGPNGAGKSTTIRHLMGFSIPDSGETSIRGISSLQDRADLMDGVSYIPGEVALPLALRGSEVLEEQKKLKGVVDTTMLDWLIKTFEYDPTLYCKEMSMGMKRKTAIISAFMSDPDIIIMDEPSSGLDPEMQEKFVELIVLEKKRGKTILLSSHIFSEVDSCCDRIAVIKDGKIVSNFIANDLKHKTLKQYHFTYENETSKEQSKATLIAKGYEVKDSTVNPLRIRVIVKDSDIQRFLGELPKTGLIDFTEKIETLEDYFMSFYKEDKSYGGIAK